MKRKFTPLNFFSITAKFIRNHAIVFATLSLIPIGGFAQNVGNKPKVINEQKIASSDAITNISKQDDAAKHEGGLVSKWKINTFDRKAFIENKGQFNDEVAGNKVLFQVFLMGVKAYFTPQGVVYKYNEVVSSEEGKDEDDKDVKGKHSKHPDPDASGVSRKMVPHYLYANWEGCNPNVTVSAEDIQPGQYGYTINKTVAIHANIYGKIVYHDLYPGIDVEYIVCKDKVALEYTIIVHPGADLSKLKIVYAGLKSINMDDSLHVIINTDIMGQFKEYAPTSFYKGIAGNVNVKTVLNGNEEQFTFPQSYDKTQTLVIDPVFGPIDPQVGGGGGYDAAYDVDYDNYGNVFVYGGETPFELSMFNSSGTLLWTYVMPATFDPYDYGAFAVDKHASTAYVMEGNYYGANPGAQALKIRNNTLLGTFSGSAYMHEMWRAQYNRCTGQVVIGGGGTNVPSYQVAMLDTNMINIVPENPLNTTHGYWDVDRLCIDPSGSPAYMSLSASSEYVVVSPFDNPNTLNQLMSVPVPALYPANYVNKPMQITAGTNCGILEVNSDDFVGNPGYYCDPNTGQCNSNNNGFNGMAASASWLYSYDDYTLTRHNKANGTYVASAGVSGYNKNLYGYAETDIYWGGLAVDQCENIYVGNQSTMYVYNSSLVKTGTTAAFPNTVYDIKLGPNEATLYACGIGFLESFSNTITTVSVIATPTPSTCGAANGSATASLTVCGSPAAGVTYSWSPGGQTTQTATGLTGGTTYTVTMSYGCGEIFTATATIGSSITPTITVTAAPAATVCSASAPVILTANGGSVYSWSDGETTSQISVNASGGYTVTPVGCGNPASINVTINPTPTITISAVPGTTICSGTSVQLTANGGGPGASYAWSPAGSLTTTTYDTTTATPATTTVYSVNVTGANGCAAAQQTITINVNPTPTVSVSGLPSLTVCSGSSVHMTASGAGAGGTYIWTDPSSTLTTTTFDTTTAFPTTTTTYTVVGTSTANCSNASSPQTVVVTVNTTPTVSITPANPGICPGGSAILTAGGATTYTWNTGGTNDTINVSPPDTIKYYVVGANGGCTDTARVTLNVGVVTVTITASSPVLCTGIPDTLTAKGATTYLWNTGGTNDTIIVSPNDTTKYWALGTSGAGCSDTGKITIDVNTSPTVTATATSPTSTVCPGDTTQAFVTVTGAGTPPYTYMWSNGQTHDTAWGLGAGSYTVTLTDANRCKSNVNTVNITVQNIVVTATAANGGNICSGGSTTLLTASGATNYIWRSNVGLTDTIYDTATASPAITTTYTVMGTTTGTCKDSATVVVTVNPTPTVVINAGLHDTAVCAGNSIVLNATGANGYTWSPTTGLNLTTGSPVTATPAVPTTYTVTGTTLAGCPDTASVFVNVLPTPTVTISISGGNDTICPGASVTLTANGAPGNTYIWSPSGSTNSSIIVTPLVSPTTVSVASYNGACTISASQSVYIFPPLTISMIPIDSGCSGAPVILGALANGGDKLPGYTYAWTPNIGTGAGPYTVPSSPATYSCTVTDGCGNTATGSTQVIINPSPVAAFTPTPNPAIAGQFVAFVDNSTLATQWYWTFGNNGDTSHASFPYYTYDIAGTYYVTLWVTSSSGCRDSVTDTVVVNELIFIPNVFTPNGDGINDVFHVTAPDAKLYNIEIFNRWGQRVFTSNAANIDWNGRSEGGVMCSDGTYYYELQFTTYAGKAYKYTGYLQLIGGGGEVQQ